jgi:hypothetical protein
MQSALITEIFIITITQAEIGISSKGGN